MYSIPHRLLSTADLNYNISSYLRSGRLIDAIKVFDEHGHLQSTVSWNMMMAGYISDGQIRCAEKLFDEMPSRDVVSWNTMLTGYRSTADASKAARHFLRMLRTGQRPTASTLTTIVSILPGKALVPQLHAFAYRFGFNTNTFVGTALIGGYSSLGDSAALRRAFGDIVVKNSVSWTALITGYTELECMAEACQAFHGMPNKNTITWTVMVNGYARNGDLARARRCFDEMPQRNVISWTTMIKGYETNRQFDDALHLFVDMRRSSGARPNQFTYSAVLTACAGCCSLVTGKSVHASIVKSGVSADVILLSSLLEMYGRCGDVDAAMQVFDCMKAHNLVTYNSMIGCCARHGQPARAMELFDEMKEAGVQPDHITFVCVLTACVHGGLVDAGERYFDLMQREYGIGATMEHYACVVDLYGRAGQLDKAGALIRGMPFEPDVIVWGALAGACGLHSSLEQGMVAAKVMQRLERDHPVIYSMMLRVYSYRGEWRRVHELKETMEGMRSRKQRGSSWFESPITVTI